MCVVQSMQFPRKHGRVLVNVTKYGSGIRFDLKEKEEENLSIEAQVLHVQSMQFPAQPHCRVLVNGTKYSSGILTYNTNPLP
jgi:hypothetical protein